MAKKMTQKAIKELKAQIRKLTGDAPDLFWGPLGEDPDAVLGKMNLFASIVGMTERFHEATGRHEFDYERNWSRQRIAECRKRLASLGVIAIQRDDGTFVRNDNFWDSARKLPFRKDGLNEKMAAMVEASGMNLRQLAEFSGANQSLISGYMHDREDPILKKDGSWTESARRFAMALGCLPEDIFPERWWKRVKERAYQEHMLRVYDQHAASFTHNRVDDRELLRDISRLLSTLTENERRVLRMRFGFEYGFALTLEQTARKLGVRRESIRQIEVIAMRKLRHPMRMSGFHEHNQNATQWYADADGKLHELTEQDTVACASDPLRPPARKVPPYRRVEE